MFIMLLFCVRRPQLFDNVNSAIREGKERMKEFKPREGGGVKCFGPHRQPCIFSLAYSALLSYASRDHRSFDSFLLLSAAA